MVWRRLVSAAIVGLMVASFLVQGVGASTLQVVVGPSLNTAQIIATSQATLVFTYPAGSAVSKALSGFNYSVTLSALNVPRDSDAFVAFQHQLRRGFENITLINMSVYLNEYAQANTTSLVVVKNVVIKAWATGVFNKTRSHVEGNFGWKSFVVKGNLDVDFEGHTVDINTVGSAILLPLGGKGVLASFLLGSFGDRPLWSSSTINFSVFNTPLSQWKRSYNAATNTTTFSKSVSSTLLFREQVSVNGQNYSVSLSYDPASTISVPGYAVAKGDTVIVQPAPPGVLQRNTVIAVSVAVIAIVVAASLLLRRKMG